MSALSPEQPEGEAGSHLLTICQVDPEHGQGFQQPRNVERAGVHDLEAGFPGQVAHNALCPRILATDEYGSPL